MSAKDSPPSSVPASDAVELSERPAAAAPAAAAPTAAAAAAAATPAPTSGDAATPARNEEARSASASVSVERPPPLSGDLGSSVNLGASVTGATAAAAAAAGGAAAVPMSPHAAAARSRHHLRLPPAVGALVPDALVPVALEDRVSEDHVRAISDNARALEGDAKDSRWFTAPEVQDVTGTDAKWVSFQRGGFLAIRVGDRLLRFDVVTTAAEILVVGIVLVVAWLVLGIAMEPGGPVFAAAMTILFGSLLGNLISSTLGLPPLVGMLIAGMVWGNLGLSKGLPSDFYKFLRNVAVAVILSRAGLTFKWKLTKPVLANVVVMSVIPQLMEAVTHAFVAVYLFGDIYPSFIFALYQGAAIACSSTAVVIPGVSANQEKGYSVTRGPGVLMLASIAFDAVFAVWFSSFVFELVFVDGKGEVSLQHRLLAAPGQIAAGAIAGILMGLLCLVIFNAFHARVAAEVERRRDSAEKFARLKCLVLNTAAGIGAIFLTYQLEVPGAGTVAVVVAAGALAFVWGKNPERDHRRLLLYKDTATLWDSFVMPCLFTVVGSTIDLKLLADGHTLLLVVSNISAGLIVKIVGCFIVSSGVGYSNAEKLFLALGWCAKSTVQAARAGKIIAHIEELSQEGWADNNPDRQAYLDKAMKAGVLTNTIVVSSILFCAVGAGVAMKALGPKLLVHEAGATVAGH